MKKLNKILAVVLTLIMLLTAIPMMSAFAAEPLSQYSVGDIIQYGSYPQTNVTDSDLISKLEDAAKSSIWLNYSYMSGSALKKYDGSAQASNYMRYKDVEVDGNKYRAVNFSTYRKNNTNYKSDTSTSYTYQDDNGYYINKTYWFKFEALDWRVLDPQTGLIVCEDIIDSQPYSNTCYQKDGSYYKYTNGTVYANNYAESSIRKWLNDNFYNTAFSSDLKGNINTATIDNKAYSSSYSQYDSVATSDKVFLLSWSGFTNTNYGFDEIYNRTDYDRKAAGSDYAKCQGLRVDKTESLLNGNNTSYWWLRSAANESKYATVVTPGGYGLCEGSDGNDNCIVNNTSYGVRPAIRLSTSTSVGYLCKNGHDWVYHEAKAATCTKAGYGAYKTCRNCQYAETRERFFPLGHSIEQREEKAATCTEKGWSAHEYCTRCDYTTDHEEYPALGHNNVNGTCTVCGYDFTKDCGCKCHSSGFANFIWKIGNFFHKIFKMDKYYECDCGRYHW